MASSSTSLAVSTPLSVPSITLDPSPQTHPPFCCTICWQRQPLGSKPKTLGRSARIVCEPCWRAVLDLSICWVCGECIVRGDEVVSLGWCFWHWGCFGCLVCGTRLEVPPGVSSDDSDEDINFTTGETGAEGSRLNNNENGGVKPRRARHVGVELEEIPLCDVCAVDNIDEPEDRILEKGFDTVTKSDGGLSRDRLQMLSEVGDEIEGEIRHVLKRTSRLFNRLKRSSKTDDTVKSMTKCRSKCHSSDALNGHGLSTLLANSSETVPRISEDGSAEFEPIGDARPSEMEGLRQQYVEEEGPSIVYVSVTDPIGDPAFRPSKTKPLPKWMNLLPSNVHRERERSRETGPYTRKYNPGQSRAVGKSYSSDGIEDDAGKSLVNSGHLESSLESLVSASSNPELPQGLCLKPRTTIAFDTIPKGDVLKSNVDRSYRRSCTAQSSYMTAQESLDHPPSRQPTFRRSPYPSRSREALGRIEGSSYFSPRSSIITLGPSSDDSSSTLTLSAASSAGVRTPIPGPFNTFPSKQNLSSLSLSSEYLERYHPVSPEPKYEKYVAGEIQPVMSKMRKRKEEECDREQNEIKRQKNVTSIQDKQGLNEEEFGLDPRRHDLTKELRNLFCEE